MPKDYYQILEVQKGASNDEIKKSYRRLAKKYHPDVNPGNKASEDKFKEINEAYAVLSDNIKKSQYDQMGYDGFRSKFDYQDIFSGFRPDQDIFGSFFKGAKRGGQGGFSFDLGGGDFSSFFENMFEQKRGRKSRGRRGQDFEYRTSVDFMTAATGGEREISFQKESVCPKCGGAGVIASSSICSQCQGNGAVLETERLRVKIPQGIAPGQKIRLKGKGAPGAGGGGSGDLFIVIDVERHPYFTREGSDIYLELPVAVFEAVLGAKVEVPTIEKPVSVTIPPGTSSGQKLRIKGKGVKGSEGQGDMYVIIKIVSPKSLDDSSRELMTSFADKNRYNPREGLF